MDEALLQRLATLEGESAVRRLMACYMDLCDVPRAVTQVSELARLFTVDAIREGAGSVTAQTLASTRVVKAVAAFVGGYLATVGALPAQPALPHQRVDRGRRHHGARAWIMVDLHLRRWAAASCSARG